MNDHVFEIKRLFSGPWFSARSWYDLMFFFPLLCISVKSGAEIGFTVLCLMGFFCPKVSLSKKAKWFYQACILYFIMNMISVLWAPNHSLYVVLGGLTFIHFLCFPLLWRVWLYYPLLIKRLCSGAVFALGVGVLWALIQYVGLHERGHAHINALLFSQALLLFWVLGQWVQSKYTQQGIFVLCALGVMFSETRTALLVFIVLSMYHLWMYSDKSIKKIMLSISICIGFVYVFLGRFVQGWQEYMHHASLASGSVVERIKMWQGGWQVFLDHPWFGVGRRMMNHEAYQKMQVISIRDYHHLHNTWISHLAGAGIFGLLSLLYMIGVLLYVFRSSSYRETLYQTLFIFLGFGMFNIMFGQGMLHALFMMMVTLCFVQDSLQPSNS